MDTLERENHEKKEERQVVSLRLSEIFY